MIRCLPTVPTIRTHRDFPTVRDPFVSGCKCMIFFVPLFLQKSLFFEKYPFFSHISRKTTRFFRHSLVFSPHFSKNTPFFSQHPRKIAVFRKFKNPKTFQPEFNHSTGSSRSIRNPDRCKTKDPTFAGCCYFINNFLVQCPIFSTFTRSKRHLSNTNL